MAKLVCNDCGWKGQPEELTCHEEYRGEFWGASAYERMYYCPCCGSDSIGEYEKPSFEEWLLEEYGINSDDLTDDDYDMYHEEWENWRED